MNMRYDNLLGFFFRILNGIFRDLPSASSGSFFRLIFSSFKLLNSLVFLGLLYMVKTHLENSGLCSIIKLFSALGIPRKQSPSHQILSKVLIFLTKLIGNLSFTTTYKSFRHNPPLISSLEPMF